MTRRSSPPESPKQDTSLEREQQQGLARLRAWGVAHAAANPVYAVEISLDASRDLIAREMGETELSRWEKLPAVQKSLTLELVSALVATRVAEGGPEIPMTQLPPASAFYDGNPRNLVHEEQGLAARQVFEAMPPMLQDFMVRRLHGVRAKRVASGGPQRLDVVRLDQPIALNDLESLAKQEIGSARARALMARPEAEQRNVHYELLHCIFDRVAQGGPAVPGAAMRKSPLWDANNVKQLITEEMAPLSTQFLFSMPLIRQDEVIRELMNIREARVARGGPKTLPMPPEFIAYVPKTAREWVTAANQGIDPGQGFDALSPQDQAKQAFEAMLHIQDEFVRRFSMERHPRA